MISIKIILHISIIIVNLQLNHTKRTFYEHYESHKPSFGR